ncbi:hypothetical protein U5A82_06045 [Sphingobium sp. CR2-8]|uniref:hypothetical protein n=1 Tax=Sphingobium sp. CR2-8 TaxID=1306534 RepID=UPI002DBFB445|nr:hypothetical protein [Sphingobium sp. CR2-8]MEC3910051.1 hypothetical protein [Sphingobium sp. CR2-8]
MFPNTPNGFPNDPARLTEREFVDRISAALRDELGTTAASAKTIMKWTNASDHTARNWINGATGPNGHHLVALSARSERVLAVFLQMCGREELLLTLDIHAAEVALAKASGAFEVLRRQRAMTTRPRGR